MEELRIEDAKTRDILVTVFQEKSIVPILGAGFTAGMPTRSGKSVPNGEHLKRYMIEKLQKTQSGFCREELENETFSSVAELFERNFADAKKFGISDYFHEHFLGVKINKTNQLRFLNEIDWPYIYTLNIDTGIEDSNRERWEVFYPNRDFDEQIDYDDRKKLYKIHGDASWFIKTLDYNEMILSESQYIYSLDKNQKFHDMLTADCENKNIIYIGCSLDNEIDLKYSVLSDKNRNHIERDTYRIYVTAEEISPLKKAKLEGYNISHYIHLQSNNDYELFYEFLIQCYLEGIDKQICEIDSLRYSTPQKLPKNSEQNIDFLANIGKSKLELPYYYFEREMVNTLNLVTDKINVIIGRRFVGKTMLAYNILDYNQRYQRYYVRAQESIDVQTIHDLMKEKNSLIVFDSDSIDDGNFVEIVNTFCPKNGNIVCVFINSYDEIIDLTGYYSNNIYQPIKLLTGKMTMPDIQKINLGLDSLGIAKFDVSRNILDNTLRIANVYNRNVVSDYSIVSKEELTMIIWLLVQNKMYFEEMVSLGLSKKYKEIVKKFSPFVQEEKCKNSEQKKHSYIKIVCNGKLGLLQILGNYVYPHDSKLGNAIAKTRHRMICESIHHIMYSFDKIDKNIVKKFIMFDTLNDIFSRRYSKINIDYIVSYGHEGKNADGAAGLIQEIYNDPKIQELKAEDPNYWLQRAKSIYMTCRSKKDIQELYEGINWAIKAEQDSEIRVSQGEKRYYRTMSNSTIQVAIMYGRIAKLNKYNVIDDINRAVEYYYKGLSDTNNSAAAKSIMNHSKGTEDFKSLVNYLINNPTCVSSEWYSNRDYLIKIRINGDILYSS